MSRGNRNVMLCERGIRTFETQYRNTLDLAAIPTLKDLSHLPVIVDPSHATGNTLWVFPMDGSDVWPRTSPGGRPAVYATRDGGSSWQRHDAGLPAEQAWWTVKRQALAADYEASVGLYFGTTSGELCLSRDEGGQWENLARHLPEIYAIETAYPD